MVGLSTLLVGTQLVPSSNVVHVLYDVSMSEWAAVSGWEGLYEVSTQGDVFSVRSGRLLSQRRHTGDGYCMVNLHRDGVRRTYTVHTLVLEAFAGVRPEGGVCRHLNGVAHDNRLSNLAWGTQAENVSDQVRHGTHAHSGKDQCHRGHPFDESNTYSHPNGQRVCRECKRISNKGYRERRETAIPAA